MATRALHQTCGIRSLPYAKGLRRLAWMTRSAIAYVRPLQGDFDSEESAITAAPGLEVLAIVRDRPGAPRERLAEALGRIAAGEASTLLAARLGALAGSLRELVALLDWLVAAHADLVVLDVDLDTGSAAGRRAVGLLLEVARWEREGEAGRTPPGRPGIALRAPELSERITVMREEGLSLQAIADALNAEGVPTPRGGARWRPSSVQAALGYRRPRPPVPGAPPPPPHPPGRKPPHAGRPRGRGGPPGPRRPRP
jgi:DNA invertase Pin-like site-specific DNA recombinase